MVDKVMFSSNSVEWGTPQNLFNHYNDKYNFAIDVCASDENHKCDTYFTIEEDALTQSWAQYGTCWMNPPYGRGLYDWMKKAYLESLKGCLVVCLIPARTDTKYWDEFCSRSTLTELLIGRLKFTGTGSNSCAPFPSAVITFSHGIETGAVKSVRLPK